MQGAKRAAMNFIAALILRATLINKHARIGTEGIAKLSEAKKRPAGGKPSGEDIAAVIATEFLASPCLA
jgi:hypothetical protein